LERRHPFFIDNKERKQCVKKIEFGLLIAFLVIGLILTACSKVPTQKKLDEQTCGNSSKTPSKGCSEFG
jgi:hypothetical protein